jgi:hypothetical protein
MKIILNSTKKTDLNTRILIKIFSCKDRNRRELKLSQINIYINVMMYTNVNVSQRNPSLI